MRGELLSPAQREQRIAEKRSRLLRFLRDEIYTTAPIAGQVMGIRSRQAIYTTLLRISRDGEIRSANLDTGDRTILWGITPHGQACAYDPDTEAPADKIFEPGRVGKLVLNHTLDLQRIRLMVEAAGWVDWVAGDRMGKWKKGMSRPDALVTHPNGNRVAIEVERTIKTRKRYASIIVERLRAVKEGHISRVVYTCPTIDQARRLKGLFEQIPWVPVNGQRVALTEKHRSAFTFTDYQHILEI